MATEIFINTDLKDLTANVVANKNRPTQVVRLPQIVEGETLDVQLSLINSNGGYDSRSGDSDVDLAVAVSAKGAAATSGTFTLTAGTETTAPIASNASGQAVQDALNALNSNTGAYGSTVVVTKLAAGSYRVIFDTVGARTIFGGTSIDLAPESEVVAATSVVGSSTIRAQQVIEISQQPAIYTSTWTTHANKFNGQLDANTARVQEFIAAGLESYFEVKVDNDVVCQVPIAVLPAVAAPNSLPAHTLPSDLCDFAADPSTNGCFSVTNWLTDLLSPHLKAVWGNITGTLSDQTDLQAALDAKGSASQQNTNTTNIATNTTNIATKAPIASPTFTGNTTAPLLTTSEIQAVAGEAIEYDAIEHRFRDEDEQPNNLLVIKKTNGVPIGKVGINHNNPKVALHVVGGHVAAGGIDDEALRVVGSGLFTSDNSTALVVAMDTDNNANTSDAILKLKRDERASETGDVEEINIGFVGTDAVYTNQTANAAYLLIENNRVFEIATGTTPTKKLQVNDTGVDVTGNLTLTDSASKIGIRTASPTAALDVGGTIKADDLNVDAQTFYVDKDDDYIKAKAYGSGSFAAITGSENQPKTTPAFGNNGKVVEKTFVKTLKLQGTGFTGLGTPVAIVNKVAGQYIVPLEMTVFNKYGTRSGNWGSTGSQGSLQIGTFQDVDNTGNFAPFLTLPVSTANTDNDWLAHKTFRNIESKQYANRDLVVKALNSNYPSSEANAPDGQWFIRVEYMLIGESGGFENNVDLTIGTAF